MKSALIGLLAETSLHFGSGSDESYIDLPVAREGATGYPVLVGSSLKGSLRDLAEQRWDGRSGKSGAPRVSAVFGAPDGAGGIIVGDARLLLLPVRSLQSAFKWVTCPHVLERLSRDAARCGMKTQMASTPNGVQVKRGAYLGAGGPELYLEEREFRCAGALPAKLAQMLEQLIGHEDVCRRIADQLVVLHDDDFVWFAKYGLPVVARNALDDDNKTSKNLWYEETLPPDTLLYSVLAERREGDLDTALALLSGNDGGRPYLQAGGNETIGQGWLHVQVLGAASRRLVEGGAS